MTVLRRGGNARGEGEDGRRRRKGENGWGHNDGHAAITRAVQVETAHATTALPYITQRRHVLARWQAGFLSSRTWPHRISSADRTCCYEGGAQQHAAHTQRAWG